MEPMMSVDELRHRWEPAKQRLKERMSSHPTSIRMHRAFSWLEHADSHDPAQHADTILMCQWIALNALYGQWDPDRGEPIADGIGWPRFLERMGELDRQGRLATLLTDRREQVMAVLGDAYLTRYFWVAPSDVRAGKARKARFDASTWYLEERFGLILHRVVERIYLLRCQLVHGAATYGGKLNRTALQRSVAFLRELLAAVLLIMIDQGESHDWGALCYPPMHSLPREQRAY